MIWIAVLLVFNLLAAGTFAAVLVVQRAALARLRTELEAMVREPVAWVPATSGSNPPFGEHITIQLLNPMQLAARQSRFADRFGTLTPALIRRMVYQKAAVVVRQQLQDYGAEAEVAVHRGL